MIGRILYIIYLVIIVGNITLTNFSSAKSGGSSWGGSTSGRSGWSSGGSHK
ncbi:hypothetical protein [Bordetella genomosp. 13]|uniref:hypothetical protein n=1 Tax=Bordetella genomosp. 13 TaxID=463040 RepID=UPI0016426DA4|nr:hypothetical protein [Bordetella genomosp. 13]